MFGVRHFGAVDPVVLWIGPAPARTEGRGDVPKSGRRSAALPAGARIAALYREGCARHAEGKIAESARVFRDILATHPRHAESLHRLGLIAFQLKRYADAEALFRRGLTTAPGMAMAHSHLGAVFQETKRFPEALGEFANEPAVVKLRGPVGDVITDLEVFGLRNASLVSE